MSTKNQQSLSRAFRRGNAILEFNSITKTNEIVFKKNTDHTKHGGWKNRVEKYSLPASMDDYCKLVTKQIKKLKLCK